MADGSFPGLVSRSRDLNSTSNVIWTGLADDSGNAVTITGNKLDVNAVVTLETAYVDDSAFTIGTDKVNAQGFLADETATDSVDEGDIGLARMTLDRRMITSSEQSGTWNIGTVTTLTGITNDVSIDDGGNTITVDGAVTVSASDLDIRDLTHVSDSVALGDGASILVDVLDGTIDALQVAITDGTDQLAINSNGSINVNFTESAITGEIHDYDTAVAVASDASDTHVYTVSTALLLKSVIVAGSGNIKFEIQAGATASPTTYAVGFLTGRQGDTKQIFFDPAIEVPTTGTGVVNVVRTNRQGAATDLYSTIIGIDA